MGDPVLVYTNRNKRYHIYASTCTYYKILEKFIVSG